jgi:hypothetical protein
MIVCKDKNPPCPKKCVSVKKNGVPNSCREYPKRKTVMVDETKPVVTSYVTAKKIAQEAVSRANTNPTSANVSAAKIAIAKVAKVEEEIATDIITEVSNVDLENIQTVPTDGAYTKQEIIQALKDEHISAADTNEIIKDPRIATYIALRESISKDEMAQIIATMNIIHTSIKTVKYNKSLDIKAKAKAINEILSKHNLCKHIRIGGRVYGEKSKKAGETTKAKLVEYSKGLGLKVTSNIKSGVCYAILGAVLTDEAEIVKRVLATDRAKLTTKARVIKPKILKTKTL